MKVNTKKDLIKSQNLVFRMGECFLFFINGLVGVKYRINKVVTRATTPPSLEGTERRIVYANKKYHSGLM
jgi:hypothetical protein